MTDDTGPKSKAFDVVTNLGPVHVDVPVSEGKDDAAMEAEAGILAKELRGGFVVSVAESKGKSASSDK